MRLWPPKVRDHIRSKSFVVNVKEYRQFIHSERSKITPRDDKDTFWYPYDTLSVLAQAGPWLKQRDDILASIHGRTILDIGCGDGLNSFFLESLGFAVHAIDHAETNYNGMKGVRLLQKHLGSSVRIFDVNLDSCERLPGERYGLALCLGLLYHVQNPFWLLTTLARNASYCLLSTRITKLTANGTDVEQCPIAYLVDESEMNSDGSNYWIFSLAGLMRLIDRTGWHVCNIRQAGDLRHSNPSSRDRDERAFCLLKSKFAPVIDSLELLDGWHQLENGCWRWTERCFSVCLRKTDKRRYSAVRLRFVVTEGLLLDGPVRLQARLAEQLLYSHEFSHPGQQEYVAPLPTGTENDDGIRLDFELSRAIRGDDSDLRERGVIVEMFRLGVDIEWSPIELL